MKDKLINMFLSVKTFIFLTATAFLWAGKITETTWMETVLVVGGLRAFSEVALSHIESKKVKSDSEK